MAGELPGMNVMAVVMNAPMELMNLGTRQLTETMGVMSQGVSVLGMELSKPPVMPAGLALPPLPGMGAPAAAPVKSTQPATVQSMYQAKQSRLLR